MEPPVMTMRKSIARGERGTVQGIKMWLMDADEFVRNVRTSRKNTRGINNKSTLFENLEILAPKGARKPATELGLVIPKLLTQVNSFKDLANDWETYGALPIAAGAIAQARQLLNALSLQLVYAPAVSVHVFPMRDGGVKVELDRGTASMEIEVLPDGTDNYLLFTPDEAVIGSYPSLFVALRHFITPQHLDSSK